MSTTIRIDDSPFCTTVNAWGGRARSIGGRRYAAIGRAAIERGPAAFLDATTLADLGLAPETIAQLGARALPLSAVLGALP